jgi:CHAT domain-containing protein
MGMKNYAALFVLLLLAAPLAGAQGDEPSAPPGGGEEVKRSPYDEEFSLKEKEYEKLIEEVRRVAPEYASLRYPRPRGYEEISEICLAEEDAALLEYIVGEKFCALWVLRRPGAEGGGEEETAPGLSVFVLERDEVVEAARAFYESISDPLSSDHEERGRALYELVFRPAEPLLEGKTDLFIVPDGILSYVPFEALQDERGRYLLDRFTMSYAPSASVLADIFDEQAAKRAAEAKRKTAFLGVGDPVFSESGKSTQEKQEKREGEGGGDSFPDEPATLRGLYEEEGYRFARLPYTGVEVEAIAELFGSGGEDVLLRGRAREEEIKQRDLAKYEIIHFATHGVVDEEFPPRSGVVLSLPGAGEGGEDGFLQLAEIFNLRLDADLVTLSACQAGLGETVRGEGLAILTRAFLHAGAPSVLVSLWSVNELTTAHLMKDFYARLREGFSTAEALRGARSAMAEKKIDLGPLERRLREREAAAARDEKADTPPTAKKGGRRVDASHPFYWAAFVLVGSPE